MSALWTTLGLDLEAARERLAAARTDSRFSRLDLWLPAGTSEAALIPNEDGTGSLGSLPLLCRIAKMLDSEEDDAERAAFRPLPARRTLMPKSFEVAALAAEV